MIFKVWNPSYKKIGSLLPNIMAVHDKPEQIIEQEIMDKESRKNIKNLQREMDRLKEAYKKIELLPCQNDAELKKKDDDLKALKKELYEVERDLNQLALLIPE